jgi:hypothetical protein
MALSFEDLASGLSSPHNTVQIDTVVLVPGFFVILKGWNVRTNLARKSAGISSRGFDLSVSYT